mmetsp:Transcript_26868/g.53664  ORF Transcript_26868/g.53664 Transcript_26868/m.53664 type:complete len:319 (+) Transcript_26868:27-983(+)
MKRQHFNLAWYCSANVFNVLSYAPSQCSTLRGIGARKNFREPNYRVGHRLFESDDNFVHIPAPAHNLVLSSAPGASRAQPPIIAHRMLPFEAVTENFLRSPAAPLPAVAFLPKIQYDTASDLPPSVLTGRTLRARVVRIIDGDTLRVRHDPLLLQILPGGNNDDGGPKKKISESTISVRLYGVDAPELSHFGNPAQPYSAEARDYVRQTFPVGSSVKVRCFSRDRYGRIIGKVSGPSTDDLSRDLASRGFATVYSGGGAEYDNNREVLEESVRTAKKGRLGLWADDDAVTPGEYKREMRERKKKLKITNEVGKDQVLR